MNCVENCGGQVDVTKMVSIRVGCASFSVAHPCSQCGRLHWEDGGEVNNRCGHKAYIKNGRLTNVDQDGKEYTV